MACGSNSCQTANSFIWIFALAATSVAPWHTLFAQLATPRWRCAEIVVLTVPANGLAATLPEVRPACRGKVVISTVVPLTFGGGRLFTPPPQGSSAEEAQEILGPEARVVASFHHIAAHELAAHLWPQLSREGRKGLVNDAAGVATRLMRETKACKQLDGLNWEINPRRLDPVQMDLPNI